MENYDFIFCRVLNYENISRGNKERIFVSFLDVIFMTKKMKNALETKKEDHNKAYIIAMRKST